MNYVKDFFDDFSSNGFLLIMLFVFISIMLCKIQKLTLPAWNGFLDSLDRHGGHILVGSFFTMVGIIMLKVMLVDDGKAVIGFGLGILSRSMGTTHPPTPSNPSDPAKPIQ